MSEPQSSKWPLETPSTVVIVGILAIILPFSLPLLLPLGGIFLIYWMYTMISNSANNTGSVSMQELPKSPPPPSANRQVAPPPPPQDAKAKEEPTPTPPPPPPSSPAPKPSPTTPTTEKSVGGAAILAKLRAQRSAKKSSSTIQHKDLIILYASQTGTAQEIAKTIGAEAESRQLCTPSTCTVASMNEYGFDKLLEAAKRGAIAVLVSSSTGDGDPPDNAAKFYGAIKRRSQPIDALKGLEFTALGLGDSNYTRFMYIPRSLKTRFTDLGAHQFYECSDADEVDGIESVVDPWMEGLWPALRVALSLDKPTTTTDITATTTTTTTTDMHGHTIPGVPALPRCRVKVVFETEDRVLVERIQKRDAEGTFPEPIFNLKSSSSSSSKKKNGEEEEVGGGGGPSAEVPYLSSVKSAKWLTNTSSADTNNINNIDERKVMHMEVEVSGTGVDYSPGDSIGVFPENDETSIDDILTRLGIDGTAVFTVHSSTEDIIDSKKEGELGSPVLLLPHLRCPSTVKGALKRGCDITTVPKKSLLRILAEHCTDPKDKDSLLLLSSSSPQGKAAYTSHILQARPSLLDLLNTHPSCTPSLDALLDALPPLQPRMYSVACCAPPPAEESRGGVDNNTAAVSVAFSVVQYETKWGRRRGVATGWLEDILLHGNFLTVGNGSSNGHTSISSSRSSSDRKIAIFFRSGGVFRPHRDLSKPMIMIGPGTGVAPFIGFLQQRRHLLNDASSTSDDNNNTSSSSIAPCWLFFGCRHPNQDYLYESELKQFKSEGTLDNLLVAFSRLGSEKVYVQHLMMKHKEELRRMIVEDGGYVYVCGDGANMARDVHSALVEIIGGGDGGGVEKLGEMTREGRYIRDIWS